MVELQLAQIVWVMQVMLVVIPCISRPCAPNNSGNADSVGTDNVDDAGNAVNAGKLSCAIGVSGTDDSGTCTVVLLLVLCQWQKCHACGVSSLSKISNIYAAVDAVALPLA